MTIWQALILGIVQGLTEFLPVSSSAHLVLTPFFLNWKLDPAVVFPFDVLVQLGTLVAVIFYFWQDLYKIILGCLEALKQKSLDNNPDAQLGLKIIIASVPAAVLGIVLKDIVEAAFHSPLAVGVFLGCTALLLALAEWLGNRTKNLEEISKLDALLIGLGQALALFPGISRSGATISAAMFRQIKRADAARFSFLMSIPVMLGAGAVSLLDLFSSDNLGSILPVILVGFLAAAVVGYFSIRWLLAFLNKNSFWGFSVYCLVLGMLTIAVTALR